MAEPEPTRITADLEKGPAVEPETESSNALTYENKQLPQDGPMSTQSAEEQDIGQALPSARSVHGVSWFLVVLSIVSGILLYALDNTITANVIPVVTRDLGDSEKLAWLSVGFLIGGVTTILPLGRLYGLFNAKSLYIISVVLFMVGSVLCGAAPNMNAFIIGRVIAGMGGNGMYLGSITLLSVNTSDKERPTYLGLLGLTFGVGMVVGPVVGGGFAESSATWRWAFYLNICIGALFAPVYIFILPGFDPRGQQKFLSRFRQFDYPGAILSIASLVCIIMAVNFGGTLYAWNSGQIITLFVLTGVLTLVFAFQQSRPFLTKAAHRVFPVALLRNKEAVLLFILMSACNAGGFIPVYYIPTFFQFSRGDSPLSSAVRLLPLITLVSFTILVNGGVLSKGGYYQPWYVGGSCLGLAGTVLLSTVTVTTPTANIYGYEVLVGIGAGCYAQAGYAVIQAVVEPSMMAYGIAFMMLAQLLGIALGLSVAGSIFVNLAFANLQQIVPDITSAQLEAIILGTSGSFLTTLPADTKAAALEIIVAAIGKLFIPAYVAFAIGLITSVFLSQRKLQATM